MPRRSILSATERASLLALPESQDDRIRFDPFGESDLALIRQRRGDANRIGFAVPLAGTRTTGLVRCDQPRVLDLDARNGRKVESLPQELLEEVMARVVTIFD